MGNSPINGELLTYSTRGWLESVKRVRFGSAVAKLPRVMRRVLASGWVGQAHASDAREGTHLVAAQEVAHAQHEVHRLGQQRVAAPRAARVAHVLPVVAGALRLLHQRAHHDAVHHGLLGHAHGAHLRPRAAEMVRSSLGDAKSSLGDAKSSLGGAESSLGDAKSSLGDAESSLGGAESSLGDAESSLGDAESSLGDAESSLGDAESSLGDAESSLGGAESSLGDAESSLGDAESSLGDAKSSCRGLRVRRWGFGFVHHSRAILSPRAKP
jgi:hypothetical protein